MPVNLFIRLIYTSSYRGNITTCINPTFTEQNNRRTDIEQCIAPLKLKLKLKAIKIYTNTKTFTTRELLTA